MGHTHTRAARRGNVYVKVMVSVWAFFMVLTFLLFAYAGKETKNFRKYVAAFALAEETFEIIKQEAKNKQIKEGWYRIDGSENAAHGITRSSTGNIVKEHPDPFYKLSDPQMEKIIGYFPSERDTAFYRAAEIRHTPENEKDLWVISHVVYAVGDTFEEIRLPLFLPLSIGQDAIY